MSVNDQFKIIVGNFVGDAFYMRSIAGFMLEGRFKAAGLRSIARLIDEDEPFSFIIDKKTTVHVPIELNKQIKQELFAIADKLEGKSE